MDFPSLYIFIINSENHLSGMFGCGYSRFRQQYGLCDSPGSVLYHLVRWEVNVRQNQEEEQMRFGIHSEEKELLSGCSGTVRGKRQLQQQVRPQ